jgi:hypothetical protein
VHEPGLRAAGDTATHPDFRGRGIFSRLTLGALDELRDEGVDFVFNTPNDQSRPGYLKMQWQVVGRVPIRMRPLHVSSLARTLRSRVPATKWSIDTEVGVSAIHALADDLALDDLLATLAAAHPPRRGDAPHERLVTDRTPAHLRWRYRFAPLHYRAVVAPGGLAEGLAIFRLRRRGQAVEAVLCELLAPRGGRKLVDQIAASSGADYVLAAGAPIRGSRLMRMPRQGPILTWRQVAPGARQPSLSAWELTMGDLELM